MDSRRTDRHTSASPRRRFGRFTRIAILTGLASALLVPATASPAHALGQSARVKYGASVYGGAGNPCGADVNPGVTREGEAYGAFKANASVKLTYTMRTRYDAGAATALATARQAGLGTAAQCGAAWAGKGKAPADALYYLWCGSHASEWCNAVNRIPVANRGSSLAFFAPDVDHGCRSDTRAPYRWLGWDRINAHVTNHKIGFINLDVRMHNINFGAGLDGHLNEGADPAEQAYGQALAPAAADVWAFTWKAYGDIYNQTQGSKPGWSKYDTSRLDLFRGQLAILWARSGFTLNGKTYQQATNELNATLCNSGQWIANVVDPGYSSSRIGLDVTFRELSSLLDSKAGNYDTPCKSDSRSCGPFNFYDFYAAMWDAPVGSFKLPAACFINKHRPIVRDTLEQSGGACILNN